MTVGEPLVCFDSGERSYDDVDHVRTYVVGAEANVAIGLARLGHSVGYTGRVGRDSLGRRITKTLRGEGVDVAALHAVDEGSTGALVKERTPDGRVEVTYLRRASAGSTLRADDIPAGLAGARRLHVTGITLALSDSAREAALSAMRVARAAGSRVSLDANFRRKLAPASRLVELFAEAAELADDVLLGWTEAALCAGTDDPARIERYARDLGRDCVVVKGPRGGARAYAAEGDASADAAPVTVVDPVGSGDAFAVGFLHARLNGDDLGTALHTGARVAARVIGTHGDYHGLPYAEAADRVSELHGVGR